jgi:hypothetical protein
MNLLRTIPSLLSLAATTTMAGVALLGTSAPAFAADAHQAAATIMVTPSTGLSDRQDVVAAISEWAPNEEIAIGQCALLGELLACEADHRKIATTGEDGAATASITVLASFVGFDPVTRTPVGHVECATVEYGCFIGAVNSDFSGRAGALISFG